MKKYFILIALTIVITRSNAQSESYQTIKDTFKGGEDVHAFSVSGFLCRTVLWMADEHEFAEAITDIKNIKLIVVPREEFSTRGLSVNGFKKVLKKDSFQELAHFRDHDDLATIFLQESPKSKMRDRYFILVEADEEVVAIEMKGTVDMNALLNLDKDLAANQ
jgi:hypothetical protein